MKNGFVIKCTIVFLLCLFVAPILATSAVETLNRESTGADSLQLRIINLRKSTVSERAARAYSYREPVLNRVQRALNRLQEQRNPASQNSLRRLSAELDAIE